MSNVCFGHFVQQYIYHKLCKPDDIDGQLILMNVISGFFFRKFIVSLFDNFFNNTIKFRCFFSFEHMYNTTQEYTTDYE